MSSTQRHRLSKRFMILCAACQERKARFRYRGEVLADRDHILCFECHRGEINRARARRLTELRSQPQVESPFGQSVALDPRQVSHRQRMFDHLQHTGAS